MDKQTVKIQLQLSDGFSRYHANGVFGGITPGGELGIYFTEDIVPLPKGIELDVELPLVRAERVEPGEHVRLAQFYVTVPLHVVPSIIQWLQSKVDDAIKIGLLKESSSKEDSTNEYSATGEDA